jgi:uncharacterized membrane protein
METTSSSTVPAERRSSAPITIGLGLAVLVIGAVFALASGWYADWYSVFRVVHVVVAVFWVGGGLTLTVLGLRAERLEDPSEIATLARQAAFVGEKLFAPAGLIVLLMGIAMVLNADLGWGHFWIVAALVGYAVTFATGIGVLSPLAKKVDTLITEQGPDSPATQAAIRKILLVARVDVTVLLLVVADMTTKPFA